MQSEHAQKSEETPTVTFPNTNYDNVHKLVELKAEYQKILERIVLDIKSII